MIECVVEEHVPIPTDISTPFWMVRDKARAACATAKRLIVEGYSGPDVDQKQAASNAAPIVNALANNTHPPGGTVDKAISTPHGAIHTNNILTAFDVAVVHDAKRIRNYVTNKLIIESENMDPRIRIKALELLGKITDVGLFTERSEVTVNNKSTIELENTLKEKLRKLMGKDGAEEAVVINNPVLMPKKLDIKSELSAN